MLQHPISMPDLSLYLKNSWMSREPSNSARRRLPANGARRRLPADRSGWTTDRRLSVCFPPSSLLPPNLLLSPPLCHTLVSHLPAPVLSSLRTPILRSLALPSLDGTSVNAPPQYSRLSSTHPSPARLHARRSPFCPRSCVGVQRGNYIKTTTNQGNRTTPSYVSFLDTKCLIGNAAKNPVAIIPLNM